MRSGIRRSSSWTPWPRRPSPEPSAGLRTRGHGVFTGCACFTTVGLTGFGGFLLPFHRRDLREYAVAGMIVVVEFAAAHLAPLAEPIDVRLQGIERLLLRHAVERQRPRRRLRCGPAPARLRPQFQVQNQVQEAGAVEPRLAAQ